MLPFLYPRVSEKFKAIFSGHSGTRETATREMHANRFHILGKSLMPFAKKEEDSVVIGLMVMEKPLVIAMAAINLQWAKSRVCVVLSDSEKVNFCCVN